MYNDSPDPFSFKGAGGARLVLRDDCNISVKAVTLHRRRDLKIFLAKFLLQGVDGICRQSGFFYLAPSLTLVGCLLVKS